MFINISNHPSSKWGEIQRMKAKQFGEIIDLPFPNVDPFLNEKGIKEMAEEYVEKVHELLPHVDSKSAIMVTGEHTLVFCLVTMLLAEGYVVLTATTERMVVEEGNEKKSIFNFVRFRKYG